MSYTCLMYHIVFSTKERRPLIVPDLKPRLVEYIGGIIRGLKGVMLEANSMPDHIHAAASMAATISVSEFLKAIKGRSSTWVNDTFPKSAPFYWQEGYGAFTVSKSAMPDVQAYIQGQEEHHRQRTFQEELIGLLERHGVEYDPRYIWQ